MNWNRGHPLLSKEGWLRASKKRPRSLTGAAGWFLSDTQPPRPLLGVAATPPWRGGECPRFHIHSRTDPIGEVSSMKNPSLRTLLLATLFGCVMLAGQQNVPFQNNIPLAPKGLANRPLPKLPMELDTGEE